MTRHTGAGFAACLLLAHSGLAYEWRSHNRMALFAPLLAGRLRADPTLTEFLTRFGETHLDTRAGDESFQDYTDEDATEVLRDGNRCDALEVPCYLRFAGGWNHALGSLSTPGGNSSRDSTPPPAQRFPERESVAPRSRPATNPHRKAASARARARLAAAATVIPGGTS